MAADQKNLKTSQALGQTETSPKKAKKQKGRARYRAAKEALQANTRSFAWRLAGCLGSLTLGIAAGTYTAIQLNKNFNTSAKAPITAMHQQWENKILPPFTGMATGTTLVVSFLCAQSALRRRSERGHLKAQEEQLRPFAPGQ